MQELEKILEEIDREPEEAIEELNHELLILECLIEEVNSFICDCDVYDDEYDDEKEQCEISLTRYKKGKKVIEMEISAIKEVQQYREIGTVEECREATEKQKGMQVNEIHVDEYFCPACGSENNCDYGKVHDKYCPMCGHAIYQEESE